MSEKKPDLSKNDDNKQPKNRRSFLDWHRQIGLIITILVIILSITGVLLNHTEEFNLDSRHVESEFLLKWYGIKKPVTTSYPVDKNWVSHVDDKIYFNNQLVATETHILTGAVAMKDFIVVATNHELILLTPEGEKIERLDATTGVPSNITSVGTHYTGHFVVKTSKGVFQANTDITDWSPGKDEMISWVHTSPLPADLKKPLLQLFRGEGLTTERVMLDLHSGRILGTAGPLLMDFAAVMFLVLSFTGCWMYARRTLIIRNRNRLLAAAATGDTYSAADLKVGEEGIVLTVIGDEMLRQRLASMGVMAGTVITAPSTSVFGDPRTYTVRGYQLSMRTTEAAMILLQTDTEVVHRLQKHSTTLNNTQSSNDNQ